ncbi:(2Fe-2S)-binding domain protein [Alkaliphilus metalliredigens QYMF]|uniref:(2Fe-2S)-binding domain protein n=1 Tax=Alkaliphilus metalliredigens (strain QYMF) TaxID=293826 RepID=A6TWS3_ALKMQ|nr:(2Fe-2S)-binding protein [Alkaliphilus metalliredigens]ABR50641.1 (2Fe-2S)-binding domain protein [Alkaliphilus metalliredigens QYMF]
MRDIILSVNGKSYKVTIEEEMRLIDVLRNKLGLLGVKEGCGEGECGACTILMDGVTVNACMVMAFQAEDKAIFTIEGLSDGVNLHPIQQAFIEIGAVQCGFCTPGMVLSAKALLDQNNYPTREEIREGISGNLCRCTGYNKMVDAIELAGELLRKGGNDSEV